MQDRVCYLSKDDLSVGYYLEMAEKRIQEMSEGGMPTDLERALLNYGTSNTCLKMIVNY